MANVPLAKVYRFMITIVLLFVALPFNNSAMAQSDKNLCLKSNRLLRQAAANGPAFFVKVHAAENLIKLSDTIGLKAEFLKLQKEAPENLIGSVRVLARLHKHNGQQYGYYVTQLLIQFEQGATAKIKLTALESLCKLKFAEPLPQIEAYADTGTNGFKSMARWALANSGKEADENRLSELLLSKNVLDYQYAAYALKFKAQVTPLTRKRLATCLSNIGSAGSARVYVMSTLFVNTNPNDRQKMKPELLKYLTGAVNERYETAEALGLVRDKKDTALLSGMLKDDNADVRVAAANALLNINCSNL